MITVIPLSAFEDNYIWLLRSPGSRSVAVVDPGDEVPVLEYLESQNLLLSAILVTHHHWDHTGGIQGLLSAYPETQVFGPEQESIPGRSKGLKDGDRITVTGLNTEFEILDVPGHTAGHIAYLCEGSLFCGDTLFTAGCGRIFDGTAIDLYRSLCRIARLPQDTLIYCAHEYTLHNLGFAKWVEPENPAVLEREQTTFELRNDNQPSVPSRLELELATNPFLRTANPVVIQSAETFARRPLETGAEVFAAVRRWKDEKYD